MNTEYTINKNIPKSKSKEFTPGKMVWELLKYRPIIFITNTLAWILVHASPLIPGLITREFFDSISGNAHINAGIWGLVILVVVTAIARSITIYAGFRLDVLFRFSISGLIRHNLLKYIMSLPGAQTLSVTSGELINNFKDDVETIENAVDWILDVIGTLSFAIGAVIVLMSVNSQVTLYVFTPLIAVVALANIASKKVQKYRRASREATSRVTGALGEIFNSVQAVQVAAAEDHVVNHFKVLNTTRHKLMLKDSLFTQILDSIFFNTVNLGTGLILLLCAQLMKSGDFSVGDFSLFVYYLTFVADFTHFFGYFLSQFQQAKVAFERLKLILRDTPNSTLVEYNKLHLSGELPLPKYREKSSEDNLEKLEVKNLSYLYPGSEGGIKNISFEVKKGSFTVITGRIGSGKSTLIRTILGLLTKNSGEVYWNGKAVDKLDEVMIPPRISYTPQIPHLLSDTVRNNLLLGLSESIVNLEDAIYSGVLDQDLEQLEKGLETVVGPMGVKLSGGQVQRVAATRMFVRSSELFFLDDISSALDVETENQLWNRIFQRKTSTCIVVSNKKTALQHADNIIVLKNGKIEAQGKLEELLNTCEEMKRIWY